jgi:hypothetical protein
MAASAASSPFSPLVAKSLTTVVVAIIPIRYYAHAHALLGRIVLCRLSAHPNELNIMLRPAYVMSVIPQKQIMAKAGMSALC